MKVIGKIIKLPFKIIFSRTTLAVVSILLQLFIIATAYQYFNDYIPMLFGIFTLISLSVVIYILNSKQNPAYKITWIIPILVFPVFGVLAYWFIHTQPGGKRINNKLMKIRESTKQYLVQDENIKKMIQDKDYHMSNFVTYMNNCSGFPAYTNTDVKYFKTGEIVYEDILKELEKAEKYIFIEFFIIERGIMWNSILDILKEKAKQGVEVRVLYDGMGSIMLLPPNYPETLKKFGIKCKKFSPVKPFISTEQNNRDHRKIIVIDGKIAYCGGINLADEYINQKDRFGYWKDTTVSVEGKAVQNFTMMFLEMWNVYSKEEEKYSDYVSENIKEEYNLDKGFVLPYADNPLDDIEIGRQVYLDILNTAQKYVYIMSPYLILDNEMLTTLIYTAQRGVEVKIMMPHIPDKKMVYYLGRSFYKDLIKAGVKIYEYTPGFIHAKMFVADDQEAVVGTINLDYRSLYLHFECGTYIYQNSVIADICQDFKECLKESQEITLEDIKSYSNVKKYIGMVLRFFAPLM